MGRLTRLYAVAALVLLTGCGSPGEEAPPAPNTLHMDFRLGRRPLTRTLTVTLARTGDAEAAAQPSVRLLSDLNGEGQFPASQVTLSATALGGPIVQVTAVADPLAPEEVRHGTYQGRIEVSAEGFATGAYDLRIELANRARGWHVVEVVASLAAGGLFGTVAKWLNDTGLALYTARRRFREVEARLRGDITMLPREYRAAREGARSAIRDGDPVAADADLVFLETHADNAMRVAGAAKALRARHLAHVKLARRQRIDHVDQVAEILAAEAQRVARLASRPVAEAADAVREARRDEQRSAFVGEVLRCVSPSSRPKELRAVLGLLCQEKYAAAVAKWAQIPEETTHAWAAKAEDVTPSAPEPVSKVEPDATPVRTRRLGLWQRLSKKSDAVWDHLLANVRFYAGVVLIVFTGIVGYTERFLDDPSFVGRQSQYFGLFFYAAAVPLGAIQVAQLLGRVWPSPGAARVSSPAPAPGAERAEPAEPDEEVPPAEEVDPDEGA